MSFFKSNFILISILIIIINFSGCSSVTPTIVTKEVLVPVKCEMSVPNRPTKVASTSKNVSNILYQYANWGVIQNSVSDQDVIGYCDRIHDYLLYDCDSIPATFEPTSIGNSIRVVSKDTNLTKLTLYLKKSSPSIWRELAKHFRIGSCNIDCVSGPLYEAMEEADADFYFLSEFQSIEGLCKESTKHRDIITLANPYNLNFYSDQIKENTPDAEIAFYSKYNIDVSFAKTPI